MPYFDTSSQHQPPMQIFIQHQGQQTGPFPIEQVRAGLADGTYQPTDLAWHEGAPEWLPLSAVPGISDSSPPPLTGPGSPPSGTVETTPLAIWSLVLGLLSFILLGLTSIPAVICGHIALGQIKRSAGALGGGGLAIAGLITGYLMTAVFILATLAGLAAPMIIKQRKKADQVEAVNNLKCIGLALLQFEEEYEKYPDDSTAVVIAEHTNTDVETETSSNAYFRQLIRAGIMDTEVIFYACTPHSRKPDNQIEGSHALEPGECSFAYISNVESSSGTPRPLAMAPLVPGTSRFDPKPFDGKALILWTDGAVRMLSIDRRTGEALLDGTSLFDPANPVWGGSPPHVALPE